MATDEEQAVHINILKEYHVFKQSESRMKMNENLRRLIKIVKEIN